MEKAAGIRIYILEYDNVFELCDCKTQSNDDLNFRRVKIITSVSQENVNDLDFYECSEGSFKVI